MKLLILILLFSLNNLTKANDSLMYSIFLKEIKQSNILNQAFDKISTDKLEFCISDQLLRQNIMVFFDEILDYEYSESKNRKNIADSLIDIYVNNFNENMVIGKLPICRDSDSCKIILFFTEIQNNRIIATAIPYDFNNRGDYNKYLKSIFPISVSFLIYIKDDQVEKIFQKILYH